MALMGSGSGVSEGVDTDGTPETEFRPDVLGYHICCA